jgi:hypothetical protein
MSAENPPRLPLNRTPEETAAAARFTLRKRAIDDYLNPPPAPRELSRPEREAMEWISAALAWHRFEAASGNPDSALLWRETLRLARRNGLGPAPDPRPDPEPPAEPRPRTRGRPRDPRISARHYARSRAIHRDFIRRFPLALPFEPPHGKALTALLDGLEQQIDEAHQDGKRILDEAAETAIRPDQDPGRPLAHYRTWRRYFLIQDLAAFIFLGFLARGGIVAFPSGRPLPLPPFARIGAGRPECHPRSRKAPPLR